MIPIRFENSLEFNHSSSLLLNFANSNTGCFYQISVNEIIAIQNPNQTEHTIPPTAVATASASHAPSNKLIKRFADSLIIAASELEYRGISLVGLISVKKSQCFIDYYQFHTIHHHPHQQQLNSASINIDSSIQLLFSIPIHFIPTQIKLFSLISTDNQLQICTFITSSYSSSSSSNSLNSSCDSPIYYSFLKFTVSTIPIIDNLLNDDFSILSPLEISTPQQQLIPSQNSKFLPLFDNFNNNEFPQLYSPPTRIDCFQYSNNQNNNNTEIGINNIDNQNANNTNSIEMLLSIGYLSGRFTILKINFLFEISNSSLSSTSSDTIEFPSIEILDEISHSFSGSISSIAIHQSITDSQSNIYKNSNNEFDCFIGLSTGGLYIIQGISFSSSSSESADQSNSTVSSCNEFHPIRIPFANQFGFPLAIKSTRLPFSPSECDQTPIQRIFVACYAGCVLIYRYSPASNDSTNQTTPTLMLPLMLDSILTIPMPAFGLDFIVDPSKFQFPPLASSSEANSDSSPLANWQPPAIVISQEYKGLLSKIVSEK